MPVKLETGQYNRASQFVYEQQDAVDCSILRKMLILPIGTLGSRAMSIVKTSKLATGNSIDRSRDRSPRILLGDCNARTT